jgi:hypothetical protein
MLNGAAKNSDQARVLVQVKGDAHGLVSHGIGLRLQQR